MNRRAQELRGLDRASRCWRLYVEQGLTQGEIAEELGMSQPAVARALQRAERLELDDLKDSRAKHVAKQHARLERLYVISVGAFEESRRPSARKRSTFSEGGSGAGMRTASVSTVDSAPGDAKFLRVATEAIAGIRKLLGLDAPTKIAATIDSDRPFLDVPDDQLRREILDLLQQSGIDPTRS